MTNMKNININTFAGKFLDGQYETNSVKTQISAGWYDWFCQDTSLRNKTRKLGKKVVQLLPSKKIDGENMYVFFKNNCPMAGSLYDDFRICDMETGDVIYTIIPSCGLNENRGKSIVYGKENDFFEPLVEGNWKDVKEFFGV